MFALAKTFWPKRSVTLPIVAPNGVAASLEAQLGVLRAENETLKARLAVVEAALESRVPE